MLNRTPFLYSLLVMYSLIAYFTIALASGKTHAADAEDAILLVAKPELVNSIYQSTVLIAKPLPNGGHVGFIVNKPTSATLGQFFPEHGPSQKIIDPLFLGGPADIDVVFALVERHDAKKESTAAMQMTPDIFLVVQDKDVDKIIETEADHARFFVGAVVWRPGELDTEMDRGLWYQLEPDAKLVLRKKTDGMREELVRKSEAKAHAI